MSFDSSPVPDFAGMSRLDGKGFVILGAGRGIGRQVTHALAQAGAQLLCVDHNPDVAAHIAAEVGGTPLAVDVTQRAGMESVFKTAAATLAQPGGIVDIVGRAIIKPIKDIDDDLYQQQHDIVFRHVWLAIQLGAPWLAAAGGGAIVVVGSISGARIPAGNQALYASQKAAVHHLVRASALEYGPQGVRINTVAPGTTRTERLNEMVGDGWPAIEAVVPLRRTARPQDIASVALFLASPMARHVTAQTIIVDGGVSSTIMRPDLPAPQKAGGKP